MKTTQSLGEQQLSLLNCHTGSEVLPMRRVTQTRGHDMEGDGGCITYTLNISLFMEGKGDFFVCVCVCVVGEDRGCVLG